MLREIIIVNLRMSEVMVEEEKLSPVFVCYVAQVAGRPGSTFHPVVSRRTHLVTVTSLSRPHTHRPVPASPPAWSSLDIVTSEKSPHLKISLVRL